MKHARQDRCIICREATTSVWLAWDLILRWFDGGTLLGGRNPG